LLAPLRGRLLIARSEFPPRHAWLVADALHGSDLLDQEPGDAAGTPWHPGAKAFRDGQLAPE
jgi:hypothetical protein